MSNPYDRVRLLMARAEVARLAMVESAERYQRAGEDFKTAYEQAQDAHLNVSLELARLGIGVGERGP
jgi:hypothetical protein